VDDMKVLSSQENAAGYIVYVKAGTIFGIGATIWEAARDASYWIMEGGLGDDEELLDAPATTRLLEAVDERGGAVRWVIREDGVADLPL
jgi:hypothetical protein